MKIWIDLSNSPHPLLFAPIARRLQELGHEVCVTARDNAQTVALARREWPDVVVIGTESRKSRSIKLAQITSRTYALASWAARERPDLALSHNSYAQIAAARMRRITAITAMDYEHQPANHLAFRLATLVFLPEAMRGVELNRQGLTPDRVRYYPGLKEELYLGDFTPTPRRDAGGAEETDQSRILIVARTPPSRAAYHQFDNRVFDELLRCATAEERVDVLVLVRHAEQRRALASLELPRLTIPEEPIDSRAAMYRADLVIGAGGTMTREAALLGVPTVSVFAGKEPAVDRWLARKGLLRQLRPGETLEFRLREKPPRPMSEIRARSAELVEWFVDALPLR